jgi:hypothetical protein
LTSTPEQGSGELQPAPKPVAGIDQLLWRRFSEAKTTGQFCDAWLALQARMIGEVAGGVVVLADPESGLPAPVAAWPEEFGTAALMPVVERVLKERKGVAARTDAGEDDGSPGGRMQLGFPVRVGRKVYGAAVLQITERPAAELQQAMRQLQWGSGSPWRWSWQGLRWRRRASRAPPPPSSPSSPRGYAAIG